jgi:hypothetical protein
MHFLLVTAGPGLRGNGDDAFRDAAYGPEWTNVASSAQTCELMPIAPITQYARKLKTS